MLYNNLNKRPMDHIAHLRTSSNQITHLRMIKLDHIMIKVEKRYYLFFEN